MIVKNEAAVIGRCLASVRPFISSWTICDTGSTDGTAEVIESEMAGIPGRLYRDAWVNFGVNRSLGLERARGSAEYHLLLDADMVLKVAEGALDNLVEDAYLIPFEGPSEYWVIRLVSDRHVWRYMGATHEYVHSDTARLAQKLAGVSVEHFEDGGSRGDKYVRDIGLLREAVEREPGNARAVFYLAQSYRDAKELELALDWYEKRALMEGWDEERWVALYQMGLIQEGLGYDWRVALNSYLQAYEFRPWRLEPVYRMAHFYRRHGQWALGYHWGRLVTEVGYPEDILFVNRAVYDFLLAYEYGLCCGRTGRVEEAVRVGGILRDGGRAPAGMAEELLGLGG